MMIQTLMLIIILYLNVHLSVTAEISILHHPNHHNLKTQTGNGPEWENIWDFTTGSDEKYYPVPRQGHSVVSWDQSEKLILYGGLNENEEILDDLWMYDYSENTQQWTKVIGDANSWIQPLAGHLCALREQTSELFIFGGLLAWTQTSSSSTSVVTNRIWTFDLLTNTWTVDSEDKNAPGPRAEATGGIYGDAIYIFGGVNGDTFEVYDDLWKYDLQNYSWEYLGNNGPSSRMSHAGCIFGTSLVIHGGRNAGYNLLADMWRYDFEEESWKEMENLEPDFYRAYHSLVSYGGFIWSFGGVRLVEFSKNRYTMYAFSTLHVHDLQQSYWLEYMPLNVPSPRFFHSATVTNSGMMYISGGRLESLIETTDLISLDLSQISDNLLVQATEDDLENYYVTSSRSALYMAIAVGTLIFSCAIGCCYYHYSSYRRNELLRQHLQREQRGTQQHLTGLSETVVKSMPLQMYQREGNNDEEAEHLDTCPICLVDLENNTQILQLPCKHLFHPECVQSWLLKHANCPLCKREFDSSGKMQTLVSQISSTEHKLEDEKTNGTD